MNAQTPHLSKYNTHGHEGYRHGLIKYICVDGSVNVANKSRKERLMTRCSQVTYNDDTG